MAKTRSLEARLTNKIGPLPAWAWAAVILGLYYAYTKLGGSSPAAAQTSAATTTDPNQTPVTGDTGSPPAGGGGSSSANLNDQLLSQLSGFGASIDALTAAVQTTPAFTDLTGGYSSTDTMGVAGAAPPPPPTTPSPAVTSTPAAGQKAVAQPFGGIKSIVTNPKTKVKTTTYNSGRIVTQAPGKSPYVSKA